MIRNSYQILDCNKNISTFNILEESNLEVAQVNSIKSELEEYHKNNNLKIEAVTNDISNQKMINNNFIFKNGYFFCSYLYHYNSTYYISTPIYEYKQNPLCPKNIDFTNIIISNTVPLNLNIIGVIYYYKYLPDTNKSECKTDVFNYVKEDIVHYDNDKYIIDIVYFNSLLNNIKYNLTYIYYKNINYTDLKKHTYKKTLKYYYINYKVDDNFNRLSTIIENTIYKSTKKNILDLQKSNQNRQTLLNFKAHTQGSENSTDAKNGTDSPNQLKSLYNILHQINLKTSIETIKDKTDNTYCNINIFNNYIIDNNNIIANLEIILTNIRKLYGYILQLETDYLSIMDDLQSIPDLSEVLTNEQEFNRIKNILDTIKNKKGDTKNKKGDTTNVVQTFSGVKFIIKELINDINMKISILHYNIDSLRTRIGDNIKDNIVLIDNLKNTINEYVSYEINMISINKNLNLPEDNKLKIFIKNKVTVNKIKVINVNNNKILDKYKKTTVINVYNNKILDKYKKNTTITRDYTIKNLKNNINFDTINKYQMNQ